MIELDFEQREVVRPLCEESREVLVRSAMEGSMGRVWVAKTQEPAFCLVRVGDFAYLLGLVPKGRRSLDLWGTLSRECNNAFINPQNELWARWLDETIDCNYRKLNRYALKKDISQFDPHKLQEFVDRLPKGYKLKKIGAGSYKKALENDWSYDFVGNFESRERFLEYGKGYVVYDGNRLVSGCSAYAYSLGMMEIMVATDPEYRRQGLALCASAKFLLDCMENGIYPNWDAANIPSVELAKRLGYIFDKEYRVPD